MTVTDPRFQPSLVAQFMDEGRAEGKAEGRAEGKAEGRAEGKAEGKADAVMLFLTAREIAVSPEAEARIRASDDLDLLDELIRRAALVTNTDALFDGLDI